MERAALTLPTRRSRTIPTRLLNACGLAAPAFFALGVAMAARQYPGYSHLTQAISELAAVDAPLPMLQTMNFFVAGALTMAFAAGLVRSGRRRLGAGLFGAVGVMMAAHGLLPCDSGCEFVTWVGTAHNVLGVIGFSAGIAGIWICGRGATRGWYRTFSSASAGVAAAGFVAWIAIAKVAMIAEANGSLQRAFVAVLLAWMFVTAARQLMQEGA